jgi:alanine-synthesizing transaminase
VCIAAPRCFNQFFHNRYKNRFDVTIDAETEAIVTIGSKEGLANLAQAVVGSGDTVLVPNPAYR